MALSDEQIDDLAEYHGLDWVIYIPFARAIEAEARKQDTELIRQLVAALEGYRRNHNDTQPCDAERAGRARLEVFDNATRRTKSEP